MKDVLKIIVWTIAICGVGRGERTATQLSVPASNTAGVRATMNSRANISLAVAAIVTAYFACNYISAAAEPITKDEVVAMVQKAVAAIKSKGAEKAYAEFDDKSGQFVRGDFYISVIGLDGKLLAYGADSHHVGDNVMPIKDGDGREIIKERVQLATKQQSFWQSYKFMNPVTKTVEPKEMYCERLNNTVVCGGIYL